MGVGDESPPAVPDVLGFELEEALARLERAGWTEFSTRLTSPPRPPGPLQGPLRVLQVRVDEGKRIVELVVAHER